MSATITTHPRQGIAQRIPRTTLETMQNDNLSNAHDSIRARIDSTASGIPLYITENYDLRTPDDAYEALHEQIDGHEDVIYTYRARLIGSQLEDGDDYGLIADPEDPMYHSQRAYLVLFARVQESPEWTSLVTALESGDAR